MFSNPSSAVRVSLMPHRAAMTAAQVCARSGVPREADFVVSMAK
jgi:hypothetical protein